MHTSRDKDDFTLPPIDGHKKKKKAAVKIVQQKKMSLVTQQSIRDTEDQHSKPSRSAQMTRSRGESRKKILRTAAQNYIDTQAKYPGTEKMLNMSYKDEYDDIFHKEPYQAGRIIQPDSPM